MAASGEIQVQILKLENKFQQACSHVQILSNLVQDIEVRYERAADNNLKSHCYTLHMRLATAEAMLNLYKKFAAQKAEEIEALSSKMQDAQPELILYESDSEWD